MPQDRAAAARAIDAFLIAIGRDAAKEPELKGTGARVADAFIDELCTGYDVDVDGMLAANLIDAHADATASVIELRDVAVTTMCPHHLMAGTGKATIGFRPRGKIVGVGALARVVDAFARRLTLQEAIGEGVVSAIDRNVHPRWVACRIEMSHACMIARGERAHGARLVTFAMRGEDAAARAEAASFVKEG